MVPGIINQIECKCKTKVGGYRWKVPCFDELVAVIVDIERYKCAGDIFNGVKMKGKG